MYPTFIVSAYLGSHKQGSDLNSLKHTQNLYTYSHKNDLIYTFKTAFRVTEHEKSILILSSYVENNEKSTFPSREGGASYPWYNKSKGATHLSKV